MTTTTPPPTPLGPCSVCGGSGRVMGVPPEPDKLEPCPRCGGSGMHPHDAPRVELVQPVEGAPRRPYAPPRAREDLPLESSSSSSSSGPQPAPAAPAVPAGLFDAAAAPRALADTTELPPTLEVDGTLYLIAAADAEGRVRAIEAATDRTLGRVGWDPATLQVRYALDPARGAAGSNMRALMTLETIARRLTPHVPHPQPPAEAAPRDVSARGPASHGGGFSAPWIGPAPGRARNEPPPVGRDARALEDAIGDLREEIGRAAASQRECLGGIAVDTARRADAAALSALTAWLAQPAGDADGDDMLRAQRAAAKLADRIARGVLGERAKRVRRRGR